MSRGVLSFLAQPGILLLPVRSHVIRRVGPIKPHAIGIVRHGCGPIREDGLDAHLLREDIQNLVQLAVCVRRVDDACIVILVNGLDIRERARAFERPCDYVEAGGFGGDGVGGWDDGLVVGTGFS